MKTGYHYGAIGQRGMLDGVELYAEKGYSPPEAFTLTHETRGTVEFVRLSDRSLDCNKSEGGCGSGDCHRRILGECRCGRHINPRPARAASAPAPKREAGIWVG